MEVLRMNVAMVKHGNCGKVYWFEVPDHLVARIAPGIRVACDTSRGRKYGVMVGSVVNADDVMEIMQASGAIFPLRKIVAVTYDIPLDIIQIPNYMKHTKPRDEKIAKRFMEFYHTGRFDTNVALDDKCVLVDGYSAYLVAQKIGLAAIPAVCEEV